MVSAVFAAAGEAWDEGLDLGDLAERGALQAFAEVVAGCPATG